MEKMQELTNPDSCINRALPGEMVFVLLARDAVAPLAVRAWAIKRVEIGKNQRTDQQIVEALKCADTMEDQRDQIRALLDQGFDRIVLPTSSFEDEVERAQRAMTPQVLTYISRDAMPANYAPSRAEFVAMSRLLMTALTQNGAMVSALVHAPTPAVPFDHGNEGR